MLRHLRTIGLMAACVFAFAAVAAPLPDSAAKTYSASTLPTESSEMFVPLVTPGSAAKARTIALMPEDGSACGFAGSGCATDPPAMASATTLTPNAGYDLALMPCDGGHSGSSCDCVDANGGCPPPVV